MIELDRLALGLLEGEPYSMVGEVSPSLPGVDRSVAMGVLAPGKMIG